MLEQGVWSGFPDQPDDASARTTQEVDAQDERLRRAGEGDACAVAELVRDFCVPLCTSIARLVGDDDVGCDLAQETLLRAWTSLPQLRERQHFKSWLYRIATNLANSHLRRVRLIRWLPWTEAAEGTPSGVPGIGGPEARVCEAGKRTRRPLRHEQTIPEYAC